MEEARREVDRLNKQNSKVDSVVTSYISTAWLTKFYTLAEPGPIDNTSVICRHGGVLPGRVETATRLCTAVPSQVWGYLHTRWVGGERRGQVDNNLPSIGLEDLELSPVSWLVTCVKRRRGQKSGRRNSSCKSLRCCMRTRTKAATGLKWFCW